ncbi:MAG TPA: hypothetical protein VNR88_05700, partial [Hyphomicrobium sp.]|nr:hypothetical protein [Hyphomicrobium sp.]
MYDTGDYSVSDFAEVFSISRPTVYRTLARQLGEQPVPLPPFLGNEMQNRYGKLASWVYSLDKPIGRSF